MTISEFIYSKIDVHRKAALEKQICLSCDICRLLQLSNYCEVERVRFYAWCQAILGLNKFMEVIFQTLD